MDLNLNDKVAIVTGGGRGIGEAICLAFANEGAHVVVSDVDFTTANEVSERIKAIGRRSIPVQADVSNLGDVTRMMESVMKEFGRIDILVNNAGISPKKEGGQTLTWEILSEEWDKVMGVNLKGTLFCSQQALKYMLPQRKGSIVNIASIAGKQSYGPMPTGAHYNVSKAGVINFTQRLASEVASYGIRVNAIAPGKIETFLAKATSEEMNKTTLEKIPMGRFGKPEEVADLVLFLASEVSGYITGETVNINGGTFMD
jgi:3-oxoacyl-[acyl-carrier protein] reductase